MALTPPQVANVLLAVMFGALFLAFLRAQTQTSALQASEVARWRASHAVGTPLQLGSRQVDSKDATLDALVGDAVQRLATHAKDGTLVLLACNYAYRSVLLNFLLRAAELGSTQIGLMCLDTRLAQWLSEHGHEGCVDVERIIPLVAASTDSTLGDAADTQDSRGNNNNKEDVRLGHIWVLRSLVIEGLVRVNVSVLSSDLDAVWLKDPFAMLSDVTARYAKVNMVVSKGTFPFRIGHKWGGTTCMGFLFIRSGQSAAGVRMFLRDARVLSALYKDDQIGFNLALEVWGMDYDPTFIVPHPAESEPLALAGKDTVVVQLHSPRASDSPKERDPNESITVAFLPHFLVERRCKKDIDIRTVVRHCYTPKSAVSKETNIKASGQWLLTKDWEHKPFIQGAQTFMQWLESLRVSKEKQA